MGYRSATRRRLHGADNEGWLNSEGALMSERFARQPFLGEHAESILEAATIAIVGLGGGGSHIAQQLAHVGIGNFVLFDPDRVEMSNLNRLVGSTSADAEARALKVDVARRLILGVNPASHVSAHPVQWQLAPESLHEADVVVSCMDSYAARQDIEVSARRYLMPLCRHSDGCAPD